MGNVCDTICDCAGTCEDEKLKKCDDYYNVVNGMWFLSYLQSSWSWIICVSTQQKTTENNRKQQSNNEFRMTFDCLVILFYKFLQLH